MSFRLKTILGIALIEVLTLSILIWSSLHSLRTSHEQELLRSSQTAAQLFASMTKDAAISYDLATLESFVEDVLSSEGVMYARVIAQGQILASGGDPTLLSQEFHSDVSHSMDELPNSIFNVDAEIFESDVSLVRVELGFATTKIEAAISEARNRTLLIAALELLLSAVLSLFFGTYLFRHLKRLQDASGRIAEGDWDHRIPVNGSDELQDTAVAFNQMAESMCQMVAQLNSTQQHLEYSSYQVQQESSLLESTGQQLADCASDQAASLEEISSSAVELNAQASQNYELATKASEKSEQMSLQAQAGSEQMQRVFNTMEELGSSIENVTQITSLIGEIATQTRMLAINASIEAARAGVHGAGFAVVAQEVQELATQTSELAEEITKVVSTSVGHVNSGGRILSETRGSLEEIFATTQATVEMMQMICQAAQEQSQGLRQVNQSLEELNQVTIENAHHSDVNAKSSSQLSQQAEELLEATRRLRLWSEDATTLSVSESSTTAVDR